jgi:hypothetical protein
VSYCAVDDCGVVINHAIVENQLHGGDTITDQRYAACAGNGRWHASGYADTGAELAGDAGGEAGKLATQDYRYEPVAP